MCNAAVRRHWDDPVCRRRGSSSALCQPSPHTHSGAEETQLYLSHSLPTHLQARLQESGIRVCLVMSREVTA